MNAAQKQEVVSKLQKNFAEAKSAIIVNYKGTGCQSLGTLRSELRPHGATFAVVKNTLAKIAVKGEEIEGIEEHFTGPTGVIWSTEDPVSPAKVVKEFVKENENFSVKAGILDGKLINESEVENLASLPSKEELFAKLLALINAPATRLLQTINAPGTNFARLLGAWRDELEKKGQE